ncbi:RICIN domain-containing protein [Promicromonospora iranensis]|uniref:RICIN domain-containing protein n=1 Tax=Promicromonospora iranensis TaxID=1105144 RepID=UPI0023A99245|nr:RICIN domain-containing protein [Promicromonospora iranensis]
MTLLGVLGGSQAALASSSEDAVPTAQGSRTALEPLPATVTPSRAADEILRYRNQATNRCMDDSSAGFRTWTCFQNSNQTWTAHPWNDGTWRFQNHATGRCIQATGASTLRTWTCDSSEKQSWYITYWNDGTRRLQNEYYGTCIDDSNGSGFRLNLCNSSTFQSWWRQ